MHVVECHDDLLSWKKYIIYTQKLIFHDLLQLCEEHNKIACAYTMFSLCWLLALLCHVLNE
jgi:hypothetical protein